jgi:DNA-binding response OmpR family regulator
MALEASLGEAGIPVAGVFATNAGALGWLARNTPELALLDVMLKDGTCIELAIALKRRGVPFAVYSGLPVSGDYPSELQGVPWLEKPVSRETLAATLMQLQVRSRAAPKKEPEIT